MVLIKEEVYGLIGRKLRSGKIGLRIAWPEIPGPAYL
jgi:hypothetical protein